MALTTLEDVVAVVTYKAKPRIKVLEERFDIKNFLVKGLKTAGVRLAAKEVAEAVFEVKKKRGKK